MVSSDSQVVTCILLLWGTATIHGYFGELAFGGLGIYGPQSPPQRPVDSIAAFAFSVSGAATLCLFAMFTRACNIERGDIEVPCSLAVASIAIMLVWSALTVAILMAPGFFPMGSIQLLVIEGILFPLVLVTGLFLVLNLRGLPVILPLVVAFGLGSIPSTAGYFVNAYSNFILAAGCLTMHRALYLRDQRICGGCSLMCAVSIACGGAFAAVPQAVFVLTVFGSVTLVMAASVVISARTARVLPQPLQRCAFVRLGYLRQALQQGLIIRRFQDMPAEAFGSIEKAAVVVITSHRWLDRYACDVCTSDHPLGVRLTTMTERLNETFPETCWKNPWRRVLDSMKYGGSDILVFFDFMGLPQIGKDAASGDPIERTKEETKLFQEALPHMGALYTMYPVLVLKEVVPGVSPYEKSGWCFSEFCSALLTKKLDTYSAAVVDEYMNNDHFLCAPVVVQLAEGTFDEQKEDKFTRAFNVDLGKRVFFNESDRDIVRRIVMGYVVLRQLADAVRQGCEAETNRLLSRCEAEGLLHVLNQAVDESLDTLLHIAVRIRSIGVAKLLVDAGALPDQKNYLGDWPDQWFLLPRCNRAAGFCRQVRSMASSACKDGASHEYRLLPW